MTQYDSIEHIIQKLNQKKAVIWDNDGTLMKTEDPNDRKHENDFFPNIIEIVTAVQSIQIVCSGYHDPESEGVNYNTKGMINRFKKLMNALPIKAAVFSPTAGAIECWVVIHTHDTNFEIREAHKDPRYQHLIGQFKKPDIGMFFVIKDLIKEFGCNAKFQDMIMIGDTKEDKEAADKAGMAFLPAQMIHSITHKASPHAS